MKNFYQQDRIPIKFKFWHKERFYYFSLAQTWGEAEIKIYNEAINDGAPLLQFTGLKDVKGNEIYEGDILDYPNEQTDKLATDGGISFWERAVVEWHDEFAQFGLSFWSPWGGEGYTGGTQKIWHYTERATVIGNIYQNQDLLECPKAHQKMIDMGYKPDEQEL